MPPNLSVADQTSEKKSEEWLTSLQDCVRCPLHKSRSQVVLPRRGEAPVLFVTDHVTDEDDLFGEPFSDRDGRYFVSLLERAKLSNIWLTASVKCKGDVELGRRPCKAWLWDEIREANPRVIVTLGLPPTSLLLKLKKSAKLSDYVGRFHSVDYSTALIAPWYSAQHCLNRGRSFERSTIEFLECIHDKANEAGT